MRRQPKAVAQILDPDQPCEQQAEFVACCHCGKLHPFAGAVGLLSAGVAVLEYCGRCDGVHCPSCVACVTVEQRLENLEAGRHPLAPRPVQILIAR